MLQAPLAAAEQLRQKNAAAEGREKGLQKGGLLCLRLWSATQHHGDAPGTSHQTEEESMNVTSIFTEIVLMPINKADRRFTVLGAGMSKPQIEDALQTCTSAT